MSAVIIAAIILASTYVISGIIRWAFILKMLEIAVTEKKSKDKENE